MSEPRWSDWDETVRPERVKSDRDYEEGDKIELHDLGGGVSRFVVTKVDDETGRVRVRRTHYRPPNARIIVTGSRDWTSLAWVRSAITNAVNYCADGRPVVVVHGDADGADEYKAEVQGENTASEPRSRTVREARQSRRDTCCGVRLRHCAGVRVGIAWPGLRGDLMTRGEHGHRVDACPWRTGQVAATAAFVEARKVGLAERYVPANSDEERQAS